LSARCLTKSKLKRSASTDRSDQQWYWCSDNEVTKLDDRPKKRAKVDPDESDEAQVKELSSKDAYMLVYKRFTVTNAVSRPAPETVMDAITADNTVLMDEVAGRESTLAALGHEFDHLATVKRDVLGSLPGVSQTFVNQLTVKNDCIVPAEALTAWLKSRDPNSEWDFSPLSCEHGSVSPDATASIKLISRTAFNKLSEYSTLTEMDVCPTCVEERFTSHTRKATHEEQVAEFDTLNDGSNGYVLPNAWLKAWRSGKLPTTDTSPTDTTYTLFCEHGKPGADIKGRVCISGDGLVLLRSIFGDFEAFETDAAACDQCAERAEASVQDRLAWAEAVRAERPIHRQQMNIFQVFDVKNYLLPKTFAEDWPKYLKNPTPRPTLDIERCPHGLLDFNPQLEPANYLTQSGWLDLCRL
jgi:ubiquitin carboxyl-terminal hydrolase 48